MASLSFCDRFSFCTSTMHACLLSRPPQRKAASSWSQEEHLSPAAGGGLPLLSTHGPRARERHSQLLGLSLWCFLLSPYLSVEMCKVSTCLECVAQQYVVCDFQRFVLHHQTDWRKRGLHNVVMFAIYLYVLFLSWFADWADWSSWWHL